MFLWISGHLLELYWVYWMYWDPLPFLNNSYLLDYIDFVKCWLSIFKWMAVEVDLLFLKLLVPDGCKLTTWLSHDLNTIWTQKGHLLDNRWSRVLIVLKANWYVITVLCICRYIPCKMQLSSIYLHSNRHVHLFLTSYFLSFYVLIGSRDLAIDSPLQSKVHLQLANRKSDTYKLTLKCPCPSVWPWPY